MTTTTTTTTDRNTERETLTTGLMVELADVQPERRGSRVYALGLSVEFHYDVTRSQWAANVLVNGKLRTFHANVTAASIAAQVRRVAAAARAKRAARQAERDAREAQYAREAAALASVTAVTGVPEGTAVEVEEREMGGYVYTMHLRELTEEQTLAILAIAKGGATTPVAAPVAEPVKATPQIVAFNTGRLYTSAGQRIAGMRLNGGVLFIDIDRMIEGFVPNVDVDELTQGAVLHAYDYRTKDISYFEGFKHPEEMQALRAAAAAVTPVATKAVR